MKLILDITVRNSFSEDINRTSHAESFSVLHCNIRSIAANYDKLTELLYELKYPFKVVGLSEIKITKLLDR